MARKRGLLVVALDGYPRGTKDFKGILGKFKMLMFQWQDGKKSIVWPEELAPGKPRFPTTPGISADRAGAR